MTNEDYGSNVEMSPELLDFAREVFDDFKKSVLAIELSDPRFKEKVSGIQSVLVLMGYVEMYKSEASASMKEIAEHMESLAASSSLKETLLHPEED